MKKKKEEDLETQIKKNKKRFITPQRYLIISIILMGLLVALNIYINFSNKSNNKITIDRDYNYSIEQNDIENDEKIVGTPNKFNNMYEIDMFGRQIWMNNIVLFIALFLCALVLPIFSNKLGKVLKGKPIISIIYLIITTALDLLFYFWLPVSLIMIAINISSFLKSYKNN